MRYTGYLGGRTPRPGTVVMTDRKELKMKVAIVERRKPSGDFKIEYRVGDVISCRRGNDLAKVRAHVRADIAGIAPADLRTLCLDTRNRPGHNAGAGATLRP